MLEHGDELSRPRPERVHQLGADTSQLFGRETVPLDELFDDRGMVVGRQIVREVERQAGGTRETNAVNPLDHVPWGDFRRLPETDAWDRTDVLAVRHRQVQQRWPSHTAEVHHLSECGTGDEGAGVGETEFRASLFERARRTGQPDDALGGGNQDAIANEALTSVSTDAGRLEHLMRGHVVMCGESVERGNREVGHTSSS
ncbi:MAG: hypothetical protein U0Q03_02210 [Acidimicrobiales bacterium]